MPRPPLVELAVATLALLALRVLFGDAALYPKEHQYGLHANLRTASADSRARGRGVRRPYADPNGDTGASHANA